MASLEEIKSTYKVIADINVRYADLDTLKHVNNSTYLSYLEESRIKYVEEVFDFNKFTLEFGVVVARVEIDYRYPIVITDSLRTYTKCIKVGNKSFTFNTIFVINDERVVTESNVVVVAVNDKGVPIPISDDWRKRIDEFET